MINSNIVKPEKFDHLHLIYHFTVPLNVLKNFRNWIKSIESFAWGLRPKGKFAFFSRSLRNN